MAEQLLEADCMDTALAIFGNCDENIKLLEQAFHVTAVCRGTQIKFSGDEEGVMKAAKAVDSMLTLREKNKLFGIAYLWLLPETKVK